MRVFCIGCIRLLSQKQTAKQQNQLQCFPPIQQQAADFCIVKDVLHIQKQKPKCKVIKMQPD